MKESSILTSNLINIYQETLVTFQFNKKLIDTCDYLLINLQGILGINLQGILGAKSIYIIRC